MECREIREKYQLYVDDEMEQEKVKSLKQHIENCKECKFFIRFEVKFTTIIQKKIKTRSAPDQLLDQIKNKLF